MLGTVRNEEEDKGWVSCRVGRTLFWGDCSVQNASVPDMWLRDRGQGGEGFREVI